MKFKTSIGDGAFLGLLVYCLLTLAMYIFWVVSTTWWPAIALTAVLFVVILPTYFGTKYVLERDSLNIYCGIFCRSIPYRNIISVTDANCITPAYALNHKRICLRYLDGENIKTTFISPTNRDAFRDALNTSMQKSIASLKSQGDPTNIEVIEAVQAAKEKLAAEHEVTRAEERALLAKEDAEKDLAKENLAKEIKKLDEIIDGNIAPESVVLSQEQENIIASRRAAERKLLAKVRRLKNKKDKEAARQLLRDKRKAEAEKAMNSENIVWEKPAKVKEPKKTADEKFADKERAKADKIKSKQEKQKQKIEKKALAAEQESFEEQEVFVEPKEKKQKPQIEKVKSASKDKINNAKPKKDKAQKAEKKSAEKQPKEKAPKLTKEQKASSKKFDKEVKAEAKKLKKEALAEAKAEKKSAAEQLAKKSNKNNKK